MAVTLPPKADKNTQSSSSGLGSLNFGSGANLKMDTIYSNLEKAEQDKLKVYDTKKESVQTKLSAYASMKNEVDKLKSLATTMASQKFQTSASAAYDGTAAYVPNATSNKAAGNYDIQVNQLASSQSSASELVSDKSAKLGSGTLSLKVGDKTAVGIDVKDASLEGVRNAINAAKDSDGNPLRVTASIVNDTRGSYLALTSKDSGAANAFSISAEGDAGLSHLISSVNTKVPAQNAKLTVNGLAIEAEKNEVKDAIPGLELTLTAVSSKPERTTVSNNNSAWAEAMGNFITSYNNTLTVAADAAAFKKGDDKSNSQAGDPGARSILSQMKNLMGPQNRAALEVFGIKVMPKATNSNGSAPGATLEVDAAKFNKAINDNPEGFQKLLVGSDGKSGLMNQVISKVDQLEDKTRGIFATSTKTLDDKLKSIDQQRERAEQASQTRLKGYKKSFIKLVQFQTQMDQQMKKMKSMFGLKSKDDD